MKVYTKKCTTDHHMDMDIKYYPAIGEIIEFFIRSFITNLVKLTKKRRK